MPPTFHMHSFGTHGPLLLVVALPLFFYRHSLARFLHALVTTILAYMRHSWSALGEQFSVVCHRLFYAHQVQPTRHTHHANPARHAPRPTRRRRVSVPYVPRAIVSTRTPMSRFQAPLIDFANPRARPPVVRIPEAINEWEEVHYRRQRSNSCRPLSEGDDDEFSLSDDELSDSSRPPVTSQFLRARAWDSPKRPPALLYSTAAFSCRFTSRRDRKPTPTPRSKLNAASKIKATPHC